MKSVIRNIKKIQRNNIFYIILGSQILLLIAYYYFIKDLVRPAGITEALKFLIFNADEYAGAIYTGIISWLIHIVLFISIVIELPMIKDFIDDDYLDINFRDGYEDIKRNKLILNAVLMLMLLVCNLYFLTYLFLLIFVVAVIMLVIILTFK